MFNVRQSLGTIGHFAFPHDTLSSHGNDCCELKQNVELQIAVVISWAPTLTGAADKRCERCGLRPRRTDQCHKECFGESGPGSGYGHAEGFG